MAFIEPMYLYQPNIACLLSCYIDQEDPALHDGVPDSKVHGANMGPTWVLSLPDGPHVGPMNLIIRGNMMFLNTNPGRFKHYTRTYH